MTIKYHPEMIQGSEEWFAIRCGLLTASQMKRVITPAKLEYSKSEEKKSILYDLLAQRVTGKLLPEFVSDDMLRGHEEEIYAREEYNKNYEPVTQCGFVTNDEWGFTLGYSPDGLVGEDGQIEGKSRAYKYQVRTILEGGMPDEFMLQVQTGLLITKRKWCDFISYSGGLHMLTTRVYPSPTVQAAILLAAQMFHGELLELEKKYEQRLRDPQMRLIPTIRRAPVSDEIAASTE